MTGSTIDTEDGSTPFDRTTLRPANPFTDSWEETLLDPVNYIIVGSILWLAGIAISQISPYGLAYSAPSATINSIPGMVVTITGFTLMGTGSSILWDVFTPDESGKSLYEGRITVSLSYNPLISLLAGAVSFTFIGATIALTMTAPLYNNQLELIGVAIATLLLLCTYAFDISASEQSN